MELLAPSRLDVDVELALPAAVELLVPATLDVDVGLLLPATVSVNVGHCVPPLISLPDPAAVGKELEIETGGFVPWLATGGAVPATIDTAKVGSMLPPPPPPPDPATDGAMVETPTKKTGGAVGTTASAVNVGYGV